MIVAKLKALCKKRGVTFCSVEKAVGIGNGSMARWDRNAPSVWKLKKVADYFGVTVDYLITE